MATSPHPRESLTKIPWAAEHEEDCAGRDDGTTGQHRSVPLGQIPTARFG